MFTWKFDEKVEHIYTTFYPNSAKECPILIAIKVGVSIVNRIGARTIVHKFGFWWTIVLIRRRKCVNLLMKSVKIKFILPEIFFKKVLLD